MNNFHNKQASEWLLFNTKWAIYQLYHGKNKLHFNDDSETTSLCSYS